MTRKRSSVVPLWILLALLLSAAAVPLSAGVGRWTPIGPEGGAVLTLAAAPGVVYAGTVFGGVFKSTDGGVSWASASRGLPSAFVGHLAVDPTDSATVYAATGLGVFKTTDGGASWSKTGLEGLIRALAISPSDPGILYAASQTVFKSADRGKTWTVLAGSPEYADVLAIDPGDPRTVYAGGYNGFFRSFDGGATWSLSITGMETRSGLIDPIYDLAIDPRQPSTLYAAALIGKVFKSTDGGATWFPARPAVDLFAPNALTIDPTSGSLYVAFYGVGEEPEEGLFKSLDGGGTWTRVLADLGIQSVALDPQAPGRVYAGLETLGVYRSEDGGSTWSRSSQGIAANAVSQVAVSPHRPGTLFAATYSGGGGIFGGGHLVRSTDGGASWTTLLGDPKSRRSPALGVLKLHPLEPDTLYITAGYGLFKTSDGGVTWQSMNRGLRSPEHVAALEMAPSDPNVLYTIGWGTFPACPAGANCPRVVLFRSTDGGNQWRRARVRLNHGELLGTLAVDPSNPSIVYAAGARLFKSTDGGVSWNETGRGLRGGVPQLLADPFAPGTLYAVVWFERRGILTTGIDKSTDGGATWTPADRDLPGWFGIHRLTADPETPDTLYAATDRGVFMTTNGGASWTVKLKDGLPVGLVSSVVVDPLDPRTLYAGTLGGGGLFVMTRVP